MTLTLGQLIAVCAAGGLLFLLFTIFRHRLPLDDSPKIEREVHVDFDAKRKAEAERIGALDKEELLAEMNRDRK